MMPSAHKFEPYYNIISAFERVVEVRVRTDRSQGVVVHRVHTPQDDQWLPDTPYDAALDTVFQIELEVPC